MDATQIEDQQISVEHRVCPPKHVYLFDNFLRPFIHNPRKLFGQYVQPGMKVLDIGCGRGFASLGFARLVGEEGSVISADLQPEMLQMVEKRAAKAGLSSRIRLHRCEADRIGVSEKCDFALAFWMAHEAPDTPALLQEVYNILNFGGHFFIAEPRMHASQDEYEQMIQDALDTGFTVLDKPTVRLSRAVVLHKSAGVRQSTAN